MAFINLRAREIQIKIVYYGPAQSGKTANLRRIYALYRNSLQSRLLTVTPGEARTTFLDFMTFTVPRVNGFDLKVRISKSIIKGSMGTRLVLSAPGGDVLRAELTNLEMPGWVPLDLLLDAAVKQAGGAVQRDPANPRALLLNPAALLTSFGVPGRFAPGAWSVNTSAAGIDLGFHES